MGSEQREQASRDEQSTCRSPREREQGRLAEAGRGDTVDGDGERGMGLEGGERGGRYGRAPELAAASLVRLFAESHMRYGARFGTALRDTVVSIQQPSPAVDGPRAAPEELRGSTESVLFRIDPPGPGAQAHVQLPEAGDVYEAVQIPAHLQQVYVDFSARLRALEHADAPRPQHTVVRIGQLQRVEREVSTRFSHLPAFRASAEFWAEPPFKLETPPQARVADHGANETTHPASIETEQALRAIEELSGQPYRDVLAALQTRLNPDDAALVQDVVFGDGAALEHAPPEQLQRGMRVLGRLVATAGAETEQKDARIEELTQKVAELEPLAARGEKQREQSRARARKYEARVRAEHPDAAKAYQSDYDRRRAAESKLRAAVEEGASREVIEGLQQELAALPRPVPVMERVKRQEAPVGDAEPAAPIRRK
jgi:hypothetical protein